MTTRQVQRLINAHDAMDGAGVKIKRISLMNQGLGDPFLLLDEIRSDDPEDHIAGFPPHPHRGIETLTYIRKGGIRHEDHLGNQGEIKSGGAQWMSSGKGVIHSEMPLKENQQLHGFQLWINMSAKNKLNAPDYRDVHPDHMPTVNTDDYRATVIAGKWRLDGKAYDGPLSNLAAGVAYLDLELNAGGQFVQPVDNCRHVVAYIYEGEVQAGQTLSQQQMALFEEEGMVKFYSEAGAKLLLLHGVPHKEPIAHYGPFVMNTMDEIEQAIQDYQNGVLTG